jgi:DNA (cytosine-5)-methyltransferase 1
MSQRPVTRRRSEAEATFECEELSCHGCTADLKFLQRTQKPSVRGRVGSIRAVDLFCGCGGMSVGLKEAARRAHRTLEVALAVDSDLTAAQTYRRNFPGARVIAADIGSLFDGRVGAQLSRTEKAVASATGIADVLLGGPPCQGHSDLNNHTRRDDPRNNLYRVMARAAEVLRAKVVIIENVVPVQWDKRGVVNATIRDLRRLGYEVDSEVIDFRWVGVPQRRRRFLLVASRIQRVNPADVIDELSEGLGEHPDRTVKWAIEDLRGLRQAGVYDTAGAPTRRNRGRINFLFDNHRYDLPDWKRPDCHHYADHTYRSVYGRLRWDRPAQTITTGFGSMGQGRYVHPSQRRTITPHEAARLQTFPDWFDFGGAGRVALGEMIGNAVPPLVMVRLGELIMPPPPR